MKITKELKNAKFEYDEQTQKFLMSDKEGIKVFELNKIYAFAFMRFVVRISQKNWLKGKKVVDKSNQDMIEYIEDSNQTTLNI